MSKIIKRSFCAEMRAVEDTEQTNEMIVEGYALRFNEDTVIGKAPWGWIESIKREAMNSADISDVVLNMNHDDSKLVARTLNKSLELIVDDVGLKIRGVIANTQTGRDFYELVKNGLITTMSFCAYVKKSQWTESVDEEMDRRDIVEFGRFFDVSGVTFAAYPQTEIAASRDSSGGGIDEDARKHFKEKEYRKQIKELDKIMEEIYE